MMISDPPMLFDCRYIGQKVQFNQHKQDSLDGFIKAGEDCFVILPPVFKLINSPNQTNNSSEPSIAAKPTASYKDKGKYK